MARFIRAFFRLYFLENVMNNYVVIPQFIKVASVPQYGNVWAAPTHIRSITIRRPLRRPTGYFIHNGRSYIG